MVLRVSRGVNKGVHTGFAWCCSHHGLLRFFTGLHRFACGFRQVFGDYIFCQRLKHYSFWEILNNANVFRRTRFREIILKKRSEGGGWGWVGWVRRGSRLRGCGRAIKVAGAGGQGRVWGQGVQGDGMRGDKNSDFGIFSRFKKTEKTVFFLFFLFVGDLGFF